MVTGHLLSRTNPGAALVTKELVIAKDSTTAKYIPPPPKVSVTVTLSNITRLMCAQKMALTLIPPSKFWKTESVRDNTPLITNSINDTDQGYVIESTKMPKSMTIMGNK